MAEEFTEASVPDQSGRTVLVTGANTGIGFEAARVLAGNGARVLLGCRSAEKASASRDRIQTLHPKARVDLLSLDLGSLDSIRRAAGEIAELEKLDRLINNAGIMIPPREETSDGFESQFGVNHLGHFALTMALALAVVQAVFPLIGAQRGDVSWMAMAKPAARAQCVFVALAFALPRAPVLAAPRNVVIEIGTRSRFSPERSTFADQPEVVMGMLSGMSSRTQVTPANA